MAGDIRVRDLRVSYGLNDVITGVDMTMAPGTVTAIIGPSGCGKSTLLRCLNRLSDLTKGCHVSGSIELDGEDILRMDPVLLRRRVGMVFQKPNPFPMSIKDNVLYGINAQNNRNVDRRAVFQTSLMKAALWDEVKDRYKDSALNLSLGQQQRLCIARSLAVSPEVLLMDEPAASLDPVSTADLESSIIAMKGEYTVVVVTHDMHEARRVSDYTAFMYNGELVEFGETAEFFASPRQERTCEYLAGRLMSSGVEASAVQSSA